MKIEQFIDEFNKDKDKEAYVRKHITHDYIPYSRKVSVCSQIAEYSTHKEIQGKKMFWNNSSLRYMLFVYAIIEEYTDIELGKKGAGRIAAFDLIEQFNVMYFVSTCLGEEYKRIDTVLKMQVDDVYSNERDLVSFLETKITSLGLISERLGEIYEHKNQRLNGSEN